MPKRSGFTLVELLVVISIIAILAAIGFTSYSAFTKNTRDVRRKSDLNFIQTALEHYNADQKYYPNLASSNSCPSKGDGLFRINCPLTDPLGNKVYTTKIPADPLPNAPQYRYEPRPSFNCVDSAICDNNSTSNKCSCYCLFAKLEGSNIQSPESNCSASSPHNYAITKP